MLSLNKKSSRPLRFRNKIQYFSIREAPGPKDDESDSSHPLISMTGLVLMILVRAIGGSGLSLVSLGALNMSDFSGLMSDFSPWAALNMPDFSGLIMNWSGLMNFDQFIAAVNSGIVLTYQRSSLVLGNWWLAAQKFCKS